MERFVLKINIYDIYKKIFKIKKYLTARGNERKWKRKKDEERLENGEEKGNWKNNRDETGTKWGKSDGTSSFWDGKMVKKKRVKKFLILDESLFCNANSLI